MAEIIGQVSKAAAIRKFASFFLATGDLVPDD
jgi:hypothetical protein